MKWGNLILEARPGNTWVLHESFWVDARPEMDIVIVVPQGYSTDLASIPDIIRGMLDKDSEWAAVVHDYIWENPTILPSGQRDRLFRLMLQASGVSSWRSWMMWCGVRLHNARTKIFNF